jgi:hypothetical protein
MGSDKSVIVEFKDRRVDVKFEGVWMRVDIDRAYKTMLNHLPAHIMELRKKGESDGTRSKRKQTEGNRRAG